MKKSLRAIALILVVLLLVIVLSLLAVWSRNNIVLKIGLWITGMVFAVFAKLRWSEYKGLSTILAWIAFGVLLYTIIWLIPAEMIPDGYYILLVLVTLSLVLWDRSRSQ